ncbi:DNA-binding response regulator, NarL/FixJ family, contains REC and HTH domains [Friedmanniella luteola]|uniref:DNA-binding response regulator, NarL/FixJ family, contains REC and HTH domains n=1 Tax=Friedmanniella luteola TaxID=546871 RepID=A0A1H2ACL4_9ACTN|nr:response regulator transcription factor [Friedmanniella luteola]SDT43607.1 DNA-binding response regulator, NarL/FixJ family, contains REC and HTH domains [Friedmanniella luteola]
MTVADEGPPVDGDGQERTVLVVDDHRSFAEMLAAALDGAPGLRCVGLAGSAAEGVALARKLQPDIVVMDIQMPREDGLVATSRVREVAPDALVAVLTAHASPEWVGRAAQAGASAFVPKNGSLQEMLDVLAGLQRGQLVVAPSAFRVVTSGAPPADLPELSQREVQVLRLLADGTAVKELAPALGITLNTARGYVKSVRQKLNATSQLEAVLKARELGLLDD